ncbi:hypothetical protein PFICI_09385 [Pestalotiopsis fici W106-1]|uniref:Phosphatidic acid phosphatase type 2/haloperoxidase domain-containing protein n=1 Tax=Pestalotiopsis fici (strain W106-1 / CGMCC3.15140) TaxID=1229662 RepID=W3X2B6_PESFW|nr:uncharacterized protein PFICI_09385 [Pestalotiopsis fici W106-1]ETS79532.1 hypothetical protein PFICI_09385 [Pestalotiopsis fici W106-1]
MYSVEKRPTFLQWLKITIVDILTMAVVGAYALVVFRLGPAATRLFPLTIRDGSEIIYPQFAYPYRSQYISSWLAGILALLVPIAIILLAQIRVTSFWDTNNGIMGVVYAIILSSAFQVSLKWIVGGLRPFFYDVCNPDINRALSHELFDSSGLNGVGYQDYMFSRDVCRTTSKAALDNAMQSFPSGHASTVFSGMVFLFLYLNAKLKVFSNYQPAMWKLVLIFVPILVATLVGGSLSVDNSHNWYDIVAGAIIGIVFGFASYRIMYAAIWDYRINHIPLNRHKSFVQGDGVEGNNMVFSEHAGWTSRRKAKKSALPAPTTTRPSR